MNDNLTKRRNYFAYKLKKIYSNIDVTMLYLYSMDYRAPSNTAFKQIYFLFQQKMHDQSD